MREEAARLKRDHERQRKVLAAKLRALRESQRVSLRCLAREMALSAPYVSDVELGRRALIISFADKFVDALARLARRP